MSTTVYDQHAALILRLGLGVMTLAHGLLKIFVFTIPGTVGFFEQLGYPGALAYVVIIAEIVGGLALITGLGTRYVALALVTVLIGATMTHIGNDWLFSNENGGWEFPAFWTLALVVQALLGDGAYSLTGVMRSRAKLANA